MPTVFVLRKDPDGVGSIATKESLQGIGSVTVDDIIKAGDEEFESRLEMFKQLFIFTPQEQIPLRHIGMEIDKDGTTGAITAHMRQYASSMTPIRPDYSKGGDESLTDNENQIFQKGMGQMGWIAGAVRADEAVIPSLLAQGPDARNQRDLRQLAKAVARIKNTDIGLVYTIGHMKRPVILCFDDAAHGNDKGGNQLGGTIVLADMDSGAVHVLNWYSHAARRKSVGPCGSETQASSKGMDRAIRYQQILGEIWGEIIPVIMATDSKNLYDKLFGLKQPKGEQRSTRDFVAFRENLSNGTVQQWIKLSDPQMLANGLTKITPFHRKQIQKLMSGEMDEYWKAGADGMNPLLAQDIRRRAADLLSGRETPQKKAVIIAGKVFLKWVYERAESRKALAGLANGDADQ